jgi:hypothetical protein
MGEGCRRGAGEFRLKAWIDLAARKRRAKWRSETNSQPTLKAPWPEPLAGNHPIAGVPAVRDCFAVKTKRGTGKRELIKTRTDKRFVRRTGGGQFKASDDVGKSLAGDRRKSAKTKVKSGYGDRGDRKTR